MTEKKEPNFHDEAVLINSIMSTAGWGKLVERIERRKAAIKARMERNETDVEVVAVEKKGENITIVVLNKDALKQELFFWKNLEGEFKMLEEEAAKPAGGSNE